MSTTTVERRKAVRIRGEALEMARQMPTTPAAPPRREVSIELLHPEDQAELKALEGDLRAGMVAVSGKKMALDHQFYRIGRLLDPLQIEERISALEAEIEQLKSLNGALSAARVKFGIGS
jgi:hypothetical protein